MNEGKTIVVLNGSFIERVHAYSKKWSLYWCQTKNISNRYGINLGISLNLWNYIFKTNYVSKYSRDKELVFLSDKEVTGNFLSRKIYFLKL